MMKKAKIMLCLIEQLNEDVGVDKLTVCSFRLVRLYIHPHALGNAVPH